MAATSKSRPSSNGGPPQRIIDLGAARVARLEALGSPVALRWDENTTFTLPVELPAEFAMRATEQDMEAAIRALLGEQTEAFFALQPSMDDLIELVNAAGKVYGLEPGESPASV
jgi:hypothetical protein